MSLISVLNRRICSTHYFSTEELTWILIQIFHRDHPSYQQSIKTDYLKTRSLTKIHWSVMAFVDTDNALNTFKYIGIGMSFRKIYSQDRQWSDISRIDHDDIAIRIVVWHLYLFRLRKRVIILKTHSFVFGNLCLFIRYHCNLI